MAKKKLRRVNRVYADKACPAVCPKKCKDYTGIAGAIGATTLVMIIAIGVLMKESAWVIVPVLGFMALLGIMLGYFTSKHK